MENYKIYCGGKFIETRYPARITNPFTGEVFAGSWLCGEAELETAIVAAMETLAEMAEMPSFHRYDILMDISLRLAAVKLEMAELLCKESGKPIRYAGAEVERSIQSFIVAAEESRRLPGELIPIDWTPAGKGKEGILKYLPLGLVAGIAPFNFPLNLAVHKIAPAIAAGCPIILKPSGSTPLSTLKLAQIIDLTNLPKGALSILPMSRETGNRLVTDPRFKLLSFTGSPAVGWEMKRLSGKKKTVLELGGNAGVIVTSTADPDLAVSKCIAGGFSYSGQVCIHTQRIFIFSELFDQFTREFTRGVNLLKKGDPLDPGTDISVMIDEANAIRVEGWINEAVKSGARILAGGRREGSYVEPTILTGTSPLMKVCCEEVFGPVVILERVENLEEAVMRVNEGCFGLQAGVFTDSIHDMNYAFRHLEVGGVMINDVPTFRVDHMPYGGVKESGLGREGIRYAMFDMLEPRLMVKNS